MMVKKKGYQCVSAVLPIANSFWDLFPKNKHRTYKKELFWGKGLKLLVA
jgi:hypothetical protein